MGHIGLILYVPYVLYVLFLFQFERTSYLIGMAAQRAEYVAPAGELQHIDRLLTHGHIINAPGEGLSCGVLVIIREQRSDSGAAEQEFFHGDFVVTGRESNAILLVFGRVIHRG